MTMAKADKKPRGDSPLNRLGPDRQQAIADFADTHTLDETVKWLRDDGFSTSRTALSDWLSAWRLGAQLRRNESTVETVLREIKNPDWTPDQVQRAGQAFFSALALDQQDPKGWFLTQQLALKKEQLAFDQARFKEGLRTKLQAGLDAVAEAFKDNVPAMELYRQARAMVNKETA
jgi:hypothetical protein